MSAPIATSTANEATASMVGIIASEEVNDDKNVNNTTGDTMNGEETSSQAEESTQKPWATPRQVSALLHTTIFHYYFIIIVVRYIFFIYLFFFIRNR